MLRNIVIKIYIVKVKSNATRSEHEVFQKFRTGCQYTLLYNVYQRKAPDSFGTHSVSSGGIVALRPHSEPKISKA